MRLADDGLLAALAKAYMRMDLDNYPAMSPLELCNLVWALAVAGTPGCDDVIAKVGDRMQLNEIDIEAFRTEQLVQLMWACAQARCPLPAATSGHVVAATSTRLHDCSAVQLATIAASYSRLEVKDTDFYAALAAQCAQRDVRAFHAPEISRLFWAFAHLGLPCPTGLTEAFAVAAEAADLSDFAELDLLTLLWAFACWPAHEVAVRAANSVVAECGRRDFATLTTQSLACLLWAVAALKMQVPFCANVVAALASRDRASFSGQDCGNIAFACTVLGITDDKLLSVIKHT